MIALLKGYSPKHLSLLCVGFLLLLLSTSARGQTASVPQLTLANTYRDYISVGDYWVSEKLDGVRAYWDGKQLFTRNGNAIVAPPWFALGFPKQALDGELWAGRGRFQFVASTVLDSNPDANQWRQIRFMVFDLHEASATFNKRLNRMRTLLENHASPYIGIVRQYKVQDHASLMRELEVVTKAGGEGLMLHRGAAPYRAGRSDDVLKLKTWQDAEAVVIAHTPGKGKFTGLMGSLLVENAGKRFRVGSGFTLPERKNPPPPGTIITYKYWGLTDQGLPRFASFLRVRRKGL
ncbi:MAG: DNA ligase [Pseudomonadales bacterium]